MVTGLLVLLAAAPALTFNGAPVPPSCLLDLIGPGAPEQQTVIAMKTCSTEGRVEQVGKRVTWRSSPDERDSYEVSYEPVGQLGAGWVVSWSWSGGGSGVFTGLSLVRVEKGRLLLARTWATGDRCNGGLVSAAVTGASVQYSVRATPADLVGATARGKALRLQAATDLEASATSCVGTLEFRDTRLTGATLDATEDTEGWTERFRLQSCYNRVHRALAASSRGHVDLVGLEALAEAVAQCVHRDGG